MSSPNSQVSLLAKFQPIFFILLLCFYCLIAITREENIEFAPLMILFLLSLPIIARSEKLIEPAKNCFRAFTIFIIATIILLIIHQGKFPKDVFPEALAIPIFPIFLYLSHYPLRMKQILIIFAGGATFLGVAACWDSLVVGSERALRAYTEILDAAGISSTMALFCLCCFFLFEKASPMRLIAIIGFLAGILCSVLTGARGSWLCLPFAIFGISYFLQRSTLMKSIFITLIFCCIFFGLLLSPISPVSERIMLIFNNIDQYSAGADAETSIGMRFDAWKTAFHAFLERPIFGWGLYDIKAHNAAYVEANDLTQKIAHFAQAHNHFFDTLAKKGLFGFAALLSMVGYHFYFFYRSFRDSQMPTQRTISFMGMLLVFCAMSFCLTDDFLNTTMGLGFYTMTVLFLASTRYPITQKGSSI